MATVISIALHKGGTAKTTTAVNLSADLADRGKRVLLIDLDFQANATFASGINSRTLDNSLYNVLTTQQQYRCRIEDAILHTDYYDVLPADKDVMDLQLESLSVTALRDTIRSVNGNYDYIIIDCPPALNIISQNALVASNCIILPTEPKPFNFTGMVDMQDTINAVRVNYNPDLQVLGILLVKYNRRTRLTKIMQDSISNYAVKLQTSLFTTTIRDGVAVAESQLLQKPLIRYAPSAKPTIDYKGFTTEVLKRLGDD